MKTLNKVCQILTVVFALGSLILFFAKFATFTLADGNTVSFIGAALGFGTKTKIAGTEYDMAKSADILFCFWLSVLGIVLSAFSFKSKKTRYFTPAVGLITGIYMLVIALSKPEMYVDQRPLSTLIGVESVKYAKWNGISFVLITAIVILLFAIIAAAYLFIDDYLEVKASNGNKKTIFKRVCSFFKDYKSEVKKIVWPGFKDVAKNTAIVLAMCAIVGAFIWLLDFGLGKLLELVLGA